MRISTISTSFGLLLALLFTAGLHYHKGSDSLGWVLLSIWIQVIYLLLLLLCALFFFLSKRNAIGKAFLWGLLGAAASEIVVFCVAIF